MANKFALKTQTYGRVMNIHPVTRDIQGVSRRTKRRAGGVPNGVMMANGKEELCYKEALGRCVCHVCAPWAHEWPGFKASRVEW